MNREELLEAARVAVCDRGDAYGSPENNFGLIARMWNVYWQARGCAHFEPYDVAIFLDLLKTARLAHDPYKLDSWVDKAGYAACGAETVCPLPSGGY